MTIYTTVFTQDGARVAKIQDDSENLYEYFVGYDFMGSIDWTTDGNEAALMSVEEAEQIVSDLESAEVPEDLVAMVSVVYGIDRNIRYNMVMPAAEAFSQLQNFRHAWRYVDIYYHGNLVYSTQGIQGFFRGWRCPDCKYDRIANGGTVTREQYNAIYGG